MDEAIFSLCSWIKRISVNCPVTKQVHSLPCFLCRLCCFDYFDWKGKSRIISDYLESRNRSKAGATSQYLLPFRKAKTCLRINWIPKIMVQFFFYLRLYVGIENVSSRLLQRMTRMDMAWSLKKMGQLYNTMPMKITKKISITVPFLGNCPPTPPLSQHYALSEKC